MSQALWKRIGQINKIKVTLKKLHEAGMMFSEEKFIKEIMRDAEVSERTAKEYLREAQLNPLETKERVKSEEQSQL